MNKIYVKLILVLLLVIAYNSVSFAGSASGGGISHNSDASEYPAIAGKISSNPVLVWNNDTSVGPGVVLYVKKWDGSSWVEMSTGSASGAGAIDPVNAARYPAIAINDSGNPVVTWTSYSGITEIYVKEWNGSSWVEMSTGSASGGGISNNPGQSYWPAIAINGLGYPVVAWYDFSGGDSEIYVKEWNGSNWVEMSSGSASGGGISDNTGESRSAAVAINGLGNPIVAWWDDSPGNVEIYIKQWNGGSWVEMSTGSASGGGISNNPGNSYDPSIAVNGSGDPVIAWGDSSGIYVKRWNGGSWVEMSTGSASGDGISDTGGVSAVPSIAVNGSGDPVIAWQDNSSGNNEIYVKQWNGSNWVEISTGSASGGGISNNAGNSRNPSIAINSSGNPVVSWYDDDTGNYEIYFKQWNGSAWEEVNVFPPNVPWMPRCEGQVNPMDVTDSTPVFSWIFSDDDIGDTQSAYRLLVADSSAGLSTNVGNMWDTGYTFTSSSYTFYSGAALQIDATYYWKMMTWDNSDSAGLYCSEQAFHMVAAPVRIFTGDFTLPDGAVYDGGAADMGIKVTVDNFSPGNPYIYVVGASSNGASNLDYFTVKYDASGNVLSSATFDSGGRNFALDIALDNSANVYVTGTSADVEWVTIKYDSDLVFVSSATTAGGDAQARGIAVDSSNNVYVGGWTQGPNYDYRLVKYDSNLVQQDLITYDAGGEDRGMGVAVDNSNNVYITGKSLVGGTSHFVTVKYDSFLTFQSSAVYTSDIYVDPNRGNRMDMTVDKNSGDVYVMGTVIGGEMGTPPRDIQVIRYDSNLTELNSTVYEPGLEGCGVTTDASGNVYVSGNYYDGIEDDWLVVKFDSNLVFLSSTVYESGSWDGPGGIALDDSDRIYVTGCSGDGMDMSTWDMRTVRFAPLGGGEPSADKPDLIIPEMTLLTPDPLPGSQVQVEIKVRNDGVGHVMSGFWVDFYSNLQAVPYPGMPGDDYYYYDTGVEGYLLSGTTVTIVAVFNYEGGTYDMYAQADTENNIDESDETNNTSLPLQLQETAGVGGITGRVYNYNIVDGSSSIRGAEVLVKLGPETKGSDITDFLGEYTIHVGTGTYEIQVIANTFATGTFPGIVINPGAPEVFNVGMFVQSNTGVIYGKVTKDDGVTPISGVLVEAWDVGNTFTIDTDTTNAIGQYRISVSSMYSTCNVKVNKSGFQEVINPGFAVSLDSMIELNIPLALVQTGPEPVDDFYPTLLPEMKVRLDWLESLSEDVDGYRVYYYYGDELDYNLLYDAYMDYVLPNQTFWESPVELERGEDYFFSVRPEDTSGYENLDTNMIVNVTVANNPGVLKAVIKVPRTGRKVVGGSLTVIAELVEGDPQDVKEIWFEYKLSHLEQWEKISGTSDKKHPYFVIWDISDDSQFPNGNYDLRAVAYNSLGNPDPQPATIMVSRNSVVYDIKEETVKDADNTTWHKKEERVYRKRDNVVRSGSSRSDKLTEVKVPVDALDVGYTDAMLVIRINDEGAEASSVMGIKKSFSTTMPIKGPLASLSSLDEYRDVYFEGIQFVCAEGKELEITIPYFDSDNDGKLDGMGEASEEEIQIWSYSGEGPWRDEEGNFIINADSNTVVVKTTHLSIFALYVPTMGENLEKAYAFPSPFRSDEHNNITFANLSGKECTIKVYNIAGELVFKQGDISEPFYTWDVVNNDGEKIASGVYIYYITDTDGNIKKEKFAIIR